jgi:polyphenol oxidase
MEYLSSSLPEGPDSFAAFAFPGRRVGGRGEGPSGEPMAVLSLASAGSMKYGTPDCAARRESFLRGAGLDPASCLGLRLAHSRRVLMPERGDELESLAGADGASGADGIILRDRGLSASVTVADCMPIWILDRDSGAFGVLHSGWRGTGILAAAVRLLGERLGSRPEALAVILGPAIGACCYAVPEDRARAFAAEFGEAAAPRRDGRAFIDLRAANVSLAERAGVGSLLSIEACTCCDPRLGSYRRQGPEAFTRMLAACGYGRPA